MISYTIVDDICNISLIPHEKDKFNILNIPNIKKLISILEVIYYSEAKIIRIYGRGGSFAVGANIKEMLGYSGYTAKGFSALGNRLFSLMENIPQIIIGEIDGYCMGGGMDFAASCDFRFAVNGSVFAHPGAKLGIITGFGGTQRISRLMKQSHSSNLFFTGETFNSDYMKEGGYLQETFNSNQEMNSYIFNFCQKVVNKSKLFIGELKKHSNAKR